MNGTIRDIKEVLDGVINSEGEFISQLNEHALCIEYTKTINDIKAYYSINYVREYDSIRISNIVVYHLIFERINSILKSVLNTESIGSDITLGAFPNVKVKGRETIYDIPEKVIATKVDRNNFLIETNLLRDVSRRILSYLKTNAFPFFQKVSSLQVVNDEIINKVPKEEYGNYIPGRFMNMKVLIIMKLCDNPSYDEFRTWALGAYKKGVEINPSRYLEDYNILVSTIEYLDGGKYLDAEAGGDIEDLQRDP